MEDRFPNLLIFFIDQDAGGHVAGVLFVVLGGVDEAGSLGEAKLDFVPEDVDIEQFPDILFALIGVESLFGGEAFADFGEFDLDPFGLVFLVLAGSNIGDELVESPHVGCPR